MEQTYPAAVLSTEESESIEGTKEEESGSVAMERHLKLNLVLAWTNLDLKEQGL